MKKAVIFDMDGVLFDTEIIYFSNIRDFFKDNDVYVRDVDLAAAAGGYYDECKRIWYTYWHKDDSYEEFSKKLADYTADYSPSMPIDYTSKLNVNAEELIDYLKTNGYKIALASSSSNELICKALNENYMNNVFDVIVSGEDFEQSKPNPQIYLHTLKELGLDANSCIAVEDSTAGIKAAKGAGIFTVAKNDKRIPFDQSMADISVTDLIEVIDIIKNI